MGNRKELITKDYLFCPCCYLDYSKTNLVERFIKNGNKMQMIFVCDCKRKLVLRLLVNGWFKIYDVTDIQIRKNLADKIKRNSK